MIEIKSVEHAEAISYGLRHANEVGLVQMGQRGDDAVVVTTDSLDDEQVGWVCHVDGSVRMYNAIGSRVVREPDLFVLDGPVYQEAAVPRRSIWRRLLSFVLPTRR